MKYSSQHAYRYAREFPLSSKIEIAIDTNNIIESLKENCKMLNILYSGNVVPTSKSSYRAFLLDLGRKFKEDDLQQLKFALKDVIPARSMERLRQPFDVFSALEDHGLLGPDKLGGLREYLDAIDRPKMVEMLDEYEDADTKFPLKPRSDNHLEKDGHSVSIKEGRHFDTSQGEFVEVRSGMNYSLTLVNDNNHRCEVSILLDGYEMFPAMFLLGPKQTYTLERPPRVAKKFKFFAIRDAPAGSGINKWRKEKNGVIQVKFTPERADMKITCAASGSGTQIISCSTQVTDVEFLEMVSDVFGNAVVTVMINSWKPLGQRGTKLVDYGVCDGSRVNVNIGGVGGIYSARFGSSIKLNASSKKNVEWRAGASTLEGKSNQKFGKARGFPIDPSLAVTLNLRLVARENEIPLPSTGDTTPLTRATLIPPPVPN